MEIHESIVQKLNELVSKSPLENKTLVEIIQELKKEMKDVKEQRDSKNSKIFNLACEHYNHSFLWGILNPRKHEELNGGEVVIRKIEKDFKSFSLFKRQMEEACENLFGSGWVWLIYDTHIGKLRIFPLNYGSPLVEESYVPLLGIDVWEHAYYLDYQWKRSEYVRAFWKCVDWKKISQIFEEVNKS